MDSDLSTGNVNIWQDWYSDNNIMIEQSISCLYQVHQPRLGHIDTIIRNFHEYNGHSIHKDTLIITGLGSSQVIMGLLYALSRLIDEVRCYEQNPSHILHQNIVNLSKEVWLSDYRSKQPTIEFVTSPNNPDGAIRIPISNADIILWDAVYAWPCYGYNLAQLVTIMNRETIGKSYIPIFSFSKSHGLAGQRLGYALIPPSIQKRYPTLISLYDQFTMISTMGTCRSGEGICRVIGNNYKAFPSIRNTLEERYESVSSKLKALYPNIQILSPKGFPYLWIYLKDMNLYDILLSYSIYVSPGNLFNSSNEYIRINLMASIPSIEKLLSLNL